MPLVRVYRLSVRYVTISFENAYTSTATTLFPEFHLGPPIVDNDGDLVDDGLELQLAEKFKPVLHKHSWEKQQNLSNVDWMLTGKATLKAYNIGGSEVYNSTIADPSQIHVYQGSADRDSFGSGEYWTFWKFDIENAFRYQGAPVGQRPVYYHVYKEDNYYYVQYWFFFNMNDLQDQTVNGSWHEGDFEHVSIKVNSGLDPVAVNFYRHEGGRTFSPSDCWWSSSNNPTYSGIAQGYTSSWTHLHIWIAANAHASYNRYSRVWRVSASAAIADFCWSLDDEYYTDNVDYDPSGYNLYFEYDYLEKLGEVQQSPLQQAGNGQYYPYAHNYYWLDHYEPINSSKEWLAFAGRFGEFWYQGCGIPIPIGAGTSSPLSPAFGGASHEWNWFTEDYSIYGFGNPFAYSPFTIVAMGFINDIPDGD